MKRLRLLLVLLLTGPAWSHARAPEGVPWNAKEYASEFKYLRERGTFTSETWSALKPEAQEKALAGAARPAGERREEVNEYWADAAKKWDNAALKKYTGQTQDDNIRAVSIWLGQEKAEALARKLSAVKVKLAKAARGLSDLDVRELEPHLLPEAIEELLSPRVEVEETAPADLSAEPPPVDGSAAALREFTGEDPSALNADSFSRLYDGNVISGRMPVAAGGTGFAAKGARSAAMTPAAAAQEKPAFAIPKLKAQPQAKAATTEEKKSQAWTSDAYGFTVTANGTTQTFRDQKQAETAIRKLPDGSISKIILYGHGSPGMQTVGPATYDAMSAGMLLQGKMAKNGVIQFSGCNTASIGGATLNPAVGLSMVARRLLYFSLPYFQDRLDGVPAEESRLIWEKTWNQDLALDTSLYVKGAVVCGYRTFGLVPGRFPVLTRILGNQEATTPGAVAGKKACYKDGREVPAP